MSAAPSILFVDDNVEELGPLAKQIDAAGMARSQVLSPADLDLESITSADLVVVDYTLDDWIHSVDVPEISLTPINGVALAAVLREHAQRQKEFPPTGFALITGQPGVLGPLPAERRPHVISRLSNVEWYFEKGGTGTREAAAQIVSLAKAIYELPVAVSTQLGSLESLLDFLGASGDLRERYRISVERCRPPIHHLATRSHGLVVLRWLLHRILPHTAFLLDEFHLAARLAVTPTSLAMVVSNQDSCFAPYRYSGPLANFDGARWWRDGIEQFLWDITSGRSTDIDQILAALAQRGCGQLQRTSVIRPVVTLDHHLNRESEFSSRDDAVPLFLDDWPSYADPAFARTEVIEQHEEMRMYILDESGE